MVVRAKFLPNKTAGSTGSAAERRNWVGGKHGERCHPQQIYGRQLPQSHRCAAAAMVKGEGIAKITARESNKQCVMRCKIKAKSNSDDGCCGGNAKTSMPGKKILQRFSETEVIGQSIPIVIDRCDQRSTIEWRKGYFLLKHLIRFFGGGR